MILKKPYAFFIRHFKMIHLIICAFLVYIAFKTNDMLHYFTEYINAGYYIKIGNVVDDYINIYIYLSLLVVLVMFMIMIILLHVKDKKNLSYILMFVLYMIITSLIITGHMNLLNMQLEVIDFRYLKLYRDLLFISMFLQYISIFFTLIRGLGFNVKNFDFESDINNMEITSSDNAEFEFTVELNTNTFARKLRSKRRHLKYFFVEHKPLFILLGIIIVAIFSVITFLNIGQKVFIHKEKETVKINNNTIVINNSYITETDYKGKTINDNYTYVVINFDIKNIGDVISNLQTEKFSLIVNKKIYAPISTDEEKFFDLGEYYKDNKIKSKSVKNYIIVFKIPMNEKNNSKFILRYSTSQIKNNTSTQKNFDIKLSPIKSFIDDNVSDIKLGQKTTLSKTILGNTKIKINKLEINDTFESKYNYCTSKTDCSELNSIITPQILSDNTKTVAKIELEIEYDEKITSSSIRDKSNLISKLGTIQYEIDEKVYSDKLVDITPNEIKNASKIKLIIDIRGIKYTYILSE